MSMKPNLAAAVELVAKWRKDAEDYRQKQHAAQSKIHMYKCAGMAEVFDRNADELETILAELGRGADGDVDGWYLPKSPLNDLQIASVEEQIKRCKLAHFTDIDIRINGKFERMQADWIKHMQPILRTKERTP